MDAYRYLAEVYDDMMGDVDYTSWASYLHKILRKGDAATILETACGTGSITNELYRLGYSITASDLSPAMLRIAKENAAKRGQQIQFIRQDLRRLQVGNRVDAVVCTCDGVNYIKPGDVAQFASSAYQALKDGGMLLFDISTQYKLRDVMGGQVFFDDGDDAACIWRNTFDESSCCLVMDVTVFVRDGELFERNEEQHVQYAHEPQTILQAMRDAGFETARAYSFLTEEEPSDTDERIQFVCVKTRR